MGLVTQAGCADFSLQGVRHVAPAAAQQVPSAPQAVPAAGQHGNPAPQRLRGHMVSGAGRCWSEAVLEATRPAVVPPLQQPGLLMLKAI